MLSESYIKRKPTSPVVVTYVCVQCVTLRADGRYIRGILIHVVGIDYRYQAISLITSDGVVCVMCCC